MQRYVPKLLIVEESHIGYALWAKYTKEPPSPFQLFHPKGDKESRAAHQTAKIAAGRVYLPVEASWLNEFEKEVLQFPADRYDDQMDSMVLFLKAMDYAISQLIINPNWRPR